MSDWARFAREPWPGLPGEDWGFPAALAAERAAGHHWFGREVEPIAPGRVLARDPETGETREAIMLGSNSYLGLSTHPRVLAASRAAAEQYGAGSGSVPLLAGTTPLHTALERAIAEFYGVDDAVLYPSGYAANASVLPVLMRTGDTIVGDILNHASIQEGCRLSGAAVRTYPHGQLDGLERALQRSALSAGRTLVVTDGVFSMDGDVAPLDEIHAAAGRHGARVMIDEAHAVGVVGPTGRGTADVHGLHGRVDVTVGSLSKGPGSVGGYAAGSRDLVNYLRYYSPSHLFSSSLPAPVVAGLTVAFEIMASDTARHARLWRNIHQLAEGLRDAGVTTDPVQSAIIPIVVGSEARLKNIMRDLWTENVFANGVTFPAVPRNRARIRLTVTTDLTAADIDAALEALVAVGRRHGLPGAVHSWAGLTSS